METTIPQFSSYLIQRLQTPQDYGKFKDNPFNFGGGLKNGGLSEDAMKLLRPIFSFDYMGAAEYEFGEVPRAMQKVAKFAADKELVHGIVTVKSNQGKWIEQPPPREYKNGRYQPQKKLTKKLIEERAALPKKTDVYYFCSKKHEEFVKQLIQDISKDNYYKKHRFKMPPSLDAAVGNGYSDPYTSLRKTVGWFDLTLGYFFFIDKMMFARTAALFGVETGIEIPVDSASK